MVAYLAVFWTWCDGSCAGSEKLDIWAFLPALVKTEPRCGVSWRREAGRRGPGGGDWKSWRGSMAPGASGTWRGETGKVGRRRDEDLPAVWVPRMSTGISWMPR